MRLVTFNSADAYLLDDLPEWSAGIELTATVPVEKESGLTARETRYPTGDTLRLKLRYQALLASPSSITAFRNCLQALNVQPVLCPLWPFGFVTPAAPDVSADNYAVYDATGTYLSITTQAALDLGLVNEGLTLYPLLVGKFSDKPSGSALSGDVASVEISFEENSQASITLPVYTPPGGLAIGEATPPLLEWPPNWTSQPKAGTAETVVDWEAVGEGRAKQQAYYEQPTVRPLEVGLTLSAGQPADMLRFFQDMAGSGGSLWVPSCLSECFLNAAAHAADTYISVDNPSARGSNTAIIVAGVPLSVTGTAGSHWNISGTVGAEIGSGERVEGLILARFKTDSLTLKFSGAGVAVATAQFIEVPWELSPPEGDTVGAVATTAFLYEFSVNALGTVQSWYFTGFERNLTYGGHTFVAAPFEFDEVQESLTMERQSTTIKSRHFSGNPLSDFALARSEWPLSIAVREVTVSGNTATLVQQLFVGEIVEAPAKGPFITATAKSMSSLIDRKIPRQLLQPSCNWIVFETLCGLDSADWKWGGTVAAYSATTGELQIDSIARISGDVVTLVAHFFAGGYLTIGAGTAIQVRSIADSTAITGGSVTVKLSVPLATAPGIGDTVYVYPGCDGNYSTCLSRFDNGINFGGFPYMPIGNPSMIKVSKNVSGGGKK